MFDSMPVQDVLVAVGAVVLIALGYLGGHGAGHD